MEQKFNWIIGSCDSSSEGIVFERVYGTFEQAKAYMLELMEQDARYHDSEDFDFTTDYADGEGWYGVNCYYDSHIDFSLVKESNCLVKTL